PSTSSTPIIEDWVSDSEEEDIPQVTKHVPSLAQSSEPVKTPRIPLHKVTIAARTIGAARPTFSKTRPHIAPYAVSKSKSPIIRPFIRHTSPEPSISPPRVNAAKLSAVRAARINAVKPSAVTAVQHNHIKKGNPQQALKYKGVIDSGCSRHMIGNMSYLSNFEELNGGYVTFGGNPKGGKITGKGKIKTGKLDFDDVLQRQR
nr:ribonuclease H-like domain-containing protein [Tanacetum cinerariifolium]